MEFELGFVSRIYFAESTTPFCLKHFRKPATVRVTKIEVRRFLASHTYVENGPKVVVCPAEIISIWGIREPFSMLTHLSGALLAFVGLFVLLRRATAHGLPRGARASLCTYGGAMILAFSASALFHYFPWSAEELIFFKKLDHAAIFLVIAGTSTVLLNAGPSSRRRELIAACWVITVAAMVLKMLVWPMPLWLSASVYLTVGWIGAISVLVALRHVSWAKLRLLVHGAAVLTIAAVVFATEAPVVWDGIVEGHELFHLLVLIGTSLHFAFILRYCTVPELLCARADRGSRARSTINLAADPQGS